MTSMSIAETEPTAAPIAYPPAPGGRILYVIGDVHGRRDLLEKVFKAIDSDMARASSQDLAPSPGAPASFTNSAASAHSPAAEEESQPSSFIGPDLTVTGQIEARGNVHIDGRVCGDVSAGRIVVGEGASIEGSLVARDVVISGSLSGTVRGDKLTLGPTACVKADVIHNSLVIEQGCQFEGRSRRLDQRHRASDPARLRRSHAALEIYLGDYIDRGEDSRGVIDALIDRSEQVECLFLRGNHEQFLLDFLSGTLDLSMWKQVGGMATLQSYGVQAGQRSFLVSQATLRKSLGEALPERHRRFYSETVPYFLAEPYLFVHAGLRPGIPIEEQHPADLMGIRQQFLEFEGDLGHIVVHGHTPVQVPEFRHNRINLDTGAYSTGRLTCLRIGHEGPELLEA